MAEYPILKWGWLAYKQELTISSPFGWRNCPFHGREFHRGVDINVPVGTAIYAPFSGKLTCFGVSPKGYGLHLVLESGNILLYFAHLSWSSLGETKGASKMVQEGNLIAKTGGAKGNRLSGSSTGPHLHFEYRFSKSGTWPKETAIDPFLILSEKLVWSSKRGGGEISAGRFGQSYYHSSRSLSGYVSSTLRGAYGSGDGSSQSSPQTQSQPDKQSGKTQVQRKNDEVVNQPKVGDEVKMEVISVSDSEIEESRNRDVTEYVDNNATEDWENEDKPVETLEGKAKGVWQIIKLAIDSSVQSLMLFDASISTMTGSLLGFFNKACQQPLVEFSGDTFGDQYYFLVRRPPFDAENMIKALEIQNIYSNKNKGYYRALEKLDEDSGYYDPPSDDSAFNPDFDLEEFKKKRKEWEKKFGVGSKYSKDVAKLTNEYKNNAHDPYFLERSAILNSNISFNTQGIYSWYQFYPQYELAGDKWQYVVPAVLFPEYASIWGSRPLTVRSQYASFKGLGTRDAKANNLKEEASDKRCRSVLDDLKYLIESNAYNPFTRQGTITIVGNRNIHRGMFIHAEIEADIDEVFYVDSVSHSYNITNNSVSLTTTLQVSHGMVKRYIKKADKSQGDVSYFDIIEFQDYEKNRDNVNIDNWREVISHWRVNQDIFNFFLKKQQFIKGKWST